MWKSVVIFVVLTTLLKVDSAKILGVFPYAGKSHFHVFQSILHELTKRGHEVTVITHYPQKVPLKGYTDISLETGVKGFSEDVVDFDGFLTTGTWQMIQGVASLGKDTCDNLNHPNFNKFLKTAKAQKFDLMLVEFFVTDCFLPVAPYLDIPFVGITSHVLMPWSNTRIGTTDNPSYVPNHFIGYSDKMNFAQRVVNTIVYFATKVVQHYIIDIPGNTAAKQRFGQDLPHLDDIARNVSALLTYTHFSLTRPRPLVPGMIEIGGLHLHNTKVKPLQKVQTFYDELILTN